MAEDEIPPDTSLQYAQGSLAPMSGMAIASMILGLIATPLDLVWELGLLVGLLACILGAASIVQINRRGLRGKPFAIAGIILGCVSLLVGITCGYMLVSNL